MSNTFVRDGHNVKHIPANGKARRLRADARRNRAHILAAARDLFADYGPGAPLEDVARRAGVGIATLYRRFPDRQALLRAVALDIWQHMTAEAHQALTEEPDAFAALARYMHRTLDLRIGAVMSALTSQLPMDEELHQAADQSAGAVQAMVDAAHLEGALRPDVVSGDIGMLIVRLDRPLPGPFSHAENSRLGHRHMDLLIAGLRANAQDESAGPLPGPAMTVADLRTLSAEETGTTNPTVRDT